MKKFFNNLVNQNIFNKFNLGVLKQTKALQSRSIKLGTKLFSGAIGIQKVLFGSAIAVSAWTGCVTCHKNYVNSNFDKQPALMCLNSSDDNQKIEHKKLSGSKKGKRKLKNKNKATAPKVDDSTQQKSKSNFKENVNSNANRIAKKIKKYERLANGVRHSANYGLTKRVDEREHNRQKGLNKQKQWSNSGLKMENRPYSCSRGRNRNLETNFARPALKFANDGSSFDLKKEFESGAKAKNQQNQHKAETNVVKNKTVKKANSSDKKHEELKNKLRVDLAKLANRIQKIKLKEFKKNKNKDNNSGRKAKIKNKKVLLESKNKNKKEPKKQVLKQPSLLLDSKHLKKANRSCVKQSKRQNLDGLRSTWARLDNMLKKAVKKQSKSISKQALAFDKFLKAHQKEQNFEPKRTKLKSLEKLVMKPVDVNKMNVDDSGLVEANLAQTKKHKKRKPSKPTTFCCFNSSNEPVEQPEKVKKHHNSKSAEQIKNVAKDAVLINKKDEEKEKKLKREQEELDWIKRYFAMDAAFVARVKKAFDMGVAELTIKKFKYYFKKDDADGQIKCYGHNLETGEENAVAEGCNDKSKVVEFEGWLWVKLGDAVLGIDLKTDGDVANDRVIFDLGQVGLEFFEEDSATEAKVDEVEKEPADSAKDLEQAEQLEELHKKLDSNKIECENKPLVEPNDEQNQNKQSELNRNDKEEQNSERFKLPEVLKEELIPNSDAVRSVNLSENKPLVEPNDEQNQNKQSELNRNDKEEQNSESFKLPEVLKEELIPNSDVVRSVNLSENKPLVEPDDEQNQNKRSELNRNDKEEQNSKSFKLPEVLKEELIPNSDVVRFVNLSENKPLVGTEQPEELKKKLGSKENEVKTELVDGQHGKNGYENRETMSPNIKKEQCSGDQDMIGDDIDFGFDSDIKLGMGPSCSLNAKEKAIFDDRIGACSSECGSTGIEQIPIKEPLTFDDKEALEEIVNMFNSVAEQCKWFKNVDNLDDFDYLDSEMASCASRSCVGVEESVEDLNETKFLEVGTEKLKLGLVKG